MPTTTLPPNTKRHPILDRLESSGPKRILALDGGGIRGALCLGFLERIEQELCIRYNNADFTLSDYYDMIGGTSTGAIIAACLAKGMKVADIKRMYLGLGKTIFAQRMNVLSGVLEKVFNTAGFKADNLEAALEKEFASLTLGGEQLKTGLCIIAKRADTYSPWIFHNHPTGEYYSQNSGLFVKDLLRASAAAPSYFRPKSLHIDKNEEGVFIDGGVSSHNNPALIMFYLCTLGHLPYKWMTGKDNLLITSVGTGFNRPKKPIKELMARKIISWAYDIPDLFMSDATSLNQLVLQSLAYTPTPQWINAEFKYMDQALINREPLLTYLRYNVSLDKTTLQGAMKKAYEDSKIESLIEMSNGQNADELYDIGCAFAKSLINPLHFTPAFDLLYGHEKRSILSQHDKDTICPWIQKEGLHYKKYKPVYARKATQVEVITSKTSAGIETQNTAQIGDYIVKNQTTSAETYVVLAANFEKRYEYTCPIDAIWHQYIPIGEVYAIHLDEDILINKKWPSHFYIDTAWQTLMYCSIGDYLVCPPDLSEFYRIGRQEFEQTYHLKK